MKKIFVFLTASLLLSMVVFSNAFGNTNDIDKQAEDIYNSMSEKDQITQILAVHAHQWEGKDANIVTSEMAKIFQDYH